MATLLVSLFKSGKELLGEKLLLTDLMTLMSSTMPG